MRELLVELTLDLRDRREELRQQISDSPADQPLMRAKLREMLGSIDKALESFGSDAHGGPVDEVVDQWDEMLDRGEDPEDLFDLDPGVLEALERRKKRRK